MNQVRERVCVRSFDRERLITIEVNDTDEFRNFLDAHPFERETIAIATAVSMCALKIPNVYAQAEAVRSLSSSPDWNIQDELAALRKGFKMVIDREEVRTVVEEGAGKFFNLVPEGILRGAMWIRWAYPHLWDFNEDR